ncbi:hypothetical protein ACFPVT_09850 [Corynebacterium choanae]|uniref:Primosomal protein n=1 Tax=Corynebacterium choanae TaxID=1862358 RepID=A0A3G6JB37_9CORY|nr:hypothetical protein [Corynebacterium choanae]AZA14198.1 hypothetical protein CCHOA_09075 [Corynebacterium choanae]
MAHNGPDHIIPLQVSLTAGDFYTLWAPSWKSRGEEWQAFLGKGDALTMFTSPGAVLHFLETEPHHDLADHPRWEAFQATGDQRVNPGTIGGNIDLIGVPALLADRPSHENVSAVARAFQVARSIGDVLALTTVQSFFASYSVLNNVERGADHYADEGGAAEWSSVGRVILSNWDSVVDAIDEAVEIYPIDSDTESAAQQRVETAQKAADEAREQLEAQRKAAAGSVDPYDASIWGQAGIDPVKISIDGKILYTLRTYVSGQPVFLGHFGEIYTFNSRKAMVRWLAEHSEHDLAKLATWPDVMMQVNNGTLEAMVHPDNAYSFQGLTQDIAAGPDSVDTTQMRQAYELLADAADWARDDGVNSVLVANPELQQYISYMLGAAGGYRPSAPYTKEADGWHLLEENLTKRFSKF